MQRGFARSSMGPFTGWTATCCRSWLRMAVLSSGKHLLGLINEVLDLAKIEAGKIELQIEPALLQDVVEAVSNTMRSLAAKKSINLRVDSDESLASFPMDGAR